jgi:hypothetical protein
MRTEYFCYSGMVPWKKTNVPRNINNVIPRSLDTPSAGVPSPAAGPSSTMDAGPSTGSGSTRSNGVRSVAGLLPSAIGCIVIVAQVEGGLPSCSGRRGQATDNLTKSDLVGMRLVIDFTMTRSQIRFVCKSAGVASFGHCIRLVCRLPHICTRTYNIFSKAARDLALADVWTDTMQRRRWN